MWFINMSSFIGILHLLFYYIILYSNICKSNKMVEENNSILDIYSNGKILVIVRESKIEFGYMNISSNQVSTDLFFNLNLTKGLHENKYEVNILPDNNIFMCLGEYCWLLKPNVIERNVTTLSKIEHIIQYKQTSSIIVNDKVFITYVPLYNSQIFTVLHSLKYQNMIGQTYDYFVEKQSGEISGFRHNSFVYFITNVEETDLYLRDFFGRDNVRIARTRLTRICNNDLSSDLVTKMMIHLACGQKPTNYEDYPTFYYQSSFLSTNKDRLFVVFNTTNNKYISCSYLMEDIEKHFDDVWDQCQAIKNVDDFIRNCEKNISCTYSWKKSSKFCRKFGSDPEKTISNCEASSLSDELGNRYGWLENFIPFFGKLEANLSGNEYIKGLDETTFLALNENGILRRFLIDAQTSPPIFGGKVDKFTTIQNEGNNTSYIIYSIGSDIFSQPIICSKLYPNCASIVWKDPLKCAYCAFWNSTGYVTDLASNNTCIDSGGSIFVEECPPVISNLEVADDKVVIRGAFLDSFVETPEVYVCDKNCLNVTLDSNQIQCMVENVTSECDVEINGNLKHTIGYNLYLPSSNNNATEDYNITTTQTAVEKNTRKITKFVISVISLLLLILLVVFIAYATSNQSPDVKESDVSRRNSIEMQHSESINIAGSLSNEYNLSSVTYPNNLERYGLTKFPDRNKIEMIKIIGKGNFGTVYLYQHKNAPHDVVAVKEITNLIEMKLISQCQHPNVVEYFGYFLKQGMYYIVMEYMDGRDFHNYLINTHNRFTCKEGCDMVLQIASGMLYLSKRHIVHRDLAARNCLMSADHQRIKISDFGLSRKTDSNYIYYQMSEDQLPYRWTAFECLNDAPFTEKSDVWSFGVLMWEIFSRAPLPYFNIKSNMRVFQYLARGNRLNYPSKECPGKLYKIMFSCWREDPDYRPKFNQLYETIENALEQLNKDEVDYAHVYLTPRVPKNDTDNSNRIIENETDENTALENVDTS